MKAISNYLKKRENGILSILKIPKQDYTDETFHDLRIEIKKLDALFELIHFCSKDFKRKKTFKAFKQIFSQAGELRELQTEEHILQKYVNQDMLKDYRKNLSSRQDQQKEDFFSLINQKYRKRLKKKYDEIIPFLSKLRPKKVKQYVLKEEKKIKKILHIESIQTENLHELRKQIKRVNYLRKILPSKKVSNRNLLPILLGEWHDCEILLQHFEEDMKKGEINAYEEKDLAIIKAKIDARKAKYLQEIKGEIPKTELFNEDTDFHDSHRM